MKKNRNVRISDEDYNLLRATIGGLSKLVNKKLDEIKGIVKKRCPLCKGRGYLLKEEKDK